MEDRPLGLMIWLRMARFVHRSNCISNEYLSQAGLTVAQFEALRSNDQNLWMALGGVT